MIGSPAHTYEVRPQPFQWSGQYQEDVHVIEKSAYDELQERYEQACDSDNAWRKQSEELQKELAEAKSDRDKEAATVDYLKGELGLQIKICDKYYDLIECEKAKREVIVATNNLEIFNLKAELERLQDMTPKQYQMEWALATKERDQLKLLAEAYRTKYAELVWHLEAAIEIVDRYGHSDQHTEWAEKLKAIMASEDARKVLEGEE